MFSHDSRMKWPATTSGPARFEFPEKTFLRTLRETRTPDATGEVRVLRKTGREGCTDLECYYFIWESPWSAKTHALRVYAMRPHIPSDPIPSPASLNLTI